MKEKEIELMERYIYEVIRRVPAEQKEEIRLELLELIGDMYDADRNGMEAVLSKLGDPKTFAKKYRDDTNYVIGQEYYENYVWVLKIVLACVVGSAILSALVQAFTGQIPADEAFMEIISGGIMSIVGAVGSVTLVFAILERQKIKVDLKEEKEWNVNNLKENSASELIRWNPAQLPPVPDKRAIISRGESTVSLIFIMVFCGLLIFAPRLFGAYVFEEKEFVRTIPIFNLEKWGYILPFLVLSLLTDFVNEMIRLVTGCYCRLVMISGIVSGIIGVITAFIAIKVMPFFNPEFPAEVSKQFGWKATEKQDLMHYWGTDFFSNVIMFIICASTVLEIAVVVYKTYRYGVEQR